MAVILYADKNSNKSGAAHVLDGIECKMIKVDVKFMNKFLAAGYVANVSELESKKPTAKESAKVSKQASLKLKA